jgi:glutamine synthetase
MMAAGLHGLRHSLDPGEPLTAGVDLATAGEPLPATLTEAVDAFESSTLARDLLGAPFLAAYAATRRGELASYERWWRQTVTDWELRRYLEHL